MKNNIINLSAKGEPASGGKQNNKGAGAQPDPHYLPLNKGERQRGSIPPLIRGRGRGWGLAIKRLRPSLLSWVEILLSWMRVPQNSKYRYLGLGLIVAVIVIILSFIPFRQSEPVKAQWFNDSWHYRMQFDVFNASTTQALTDFQVRISTTTLTLPTLYSNSKVKSNFTDLRFTDINGNLLDYWFPDATSTMGAVYVKFPNLPKNATSTLFMYYGNNSADDDRNGPNVFPDFFEDFSDGNYTTGKHAWTLASGSYSVAGKDKYLQSGTAGLISTPSAKAYGVWEFDWYKGADGNTVSAWFVADRVRTLNASQGYGVFIYSDETYYLLRNNVGSNNNLSKSDASYVSNGRWYQNKISRNSVGQYTSYLNNTLVSMAVGYTNPVTDNTYTSSTYFVIDLDATDRIDNIFWRKFAQTDPIVAATTGTSEETGGGPVGYWKFDEGYGTTAFDSSSYKNNGTLTNMSTTGTSTVWTTGKVGKALMFDGSNDYVNLGTSDVIDLTADATYMAWIKLTPAVYPDATTNFIIFSNETLTTMGSTLRVDGGGRYLFYRTAQAGASQASYTSTLLNKNQWYHIALIRSGTDVIFYINGRISGETVNSTHISPVNSTNNFNIGKSGSQYFNGLIDEFKIYNYALTASQILAEYNQGKSVVLSQTPEQVQNMQEGLVGWWKMNEATTTWDGAGDRVNDYSGNNLAGTAAGNAHATTTAMYGNAAEFDGSGDNVQVTDTSSSPLDLSGYGVLSAWIRPRVVTGSQYIIDKDETTAYALMISGTTFYGYFGNTSCSGGTLSALTWQHVSAVYDGSYVRCYLNGVEVGKTTKTGPLADQNTSLYIGSDGGATNDFNGIIDDVKIYNTPRTADQIMQDYLTGPGPIAYYDFEEGRGTTANDKSGQGYNGTITVGSGGWKKGKIGRTYDFDGANTKIDTGSEWIDTQAVTVSAWIYPEGWGENNSGGIIQNGKFAFKVWNYSSPYASLVSWNGDIGNTYSAANSIILNTWQHVVVSRTVAGVMNFYINGQLSGTANQAGSLPAAGTTNVIIGNNNGQTATFNGQIDDLKVYNYVLTPWQIAQEYNGGKPIAQWSFDEGYGTTAYNSYATSTNALAGTLTNMSTSGTSTVWRLGKIGKALYFDGINDYVSVGNQSALNLTSDGTITGWIKLTEDIVTNDWGAVVGKNNWGADRDGYACYFQGYTNDFRCLTAGASTAAISIYTKISKFKNTWKHFAFTWNDSVQKLYIDGTLVDSDTPKVASPSSYSLYIGRPSTGGSNSTLNFPGYLDEIKIYSYALSPVQVKNDYNAGNVVTLGTSDSGQNIQQGLVGWWKMDEATTTWDGAGDRVNDYSGNNNYGTAYNHAHATTTAKYGNAGEFDGTDDYVQFTSTINPGGNDFTLEAWVTDKNTADTFEVIIGTSQNIGGLMYYGATGVVLSPAGGGGGYVTWSGARPTDINWHFLAVVVDCGQGGDVAELFVDGQAKGKKNIGTFSGSGGTGCSAFTASNEQFKYIGRDYCGSSDCYFQGLIDDVKIYNTARTADQIMQDYLIGPNPIAYYNFEEGSGTTAYDKSGQGYNGTITAGAGGYKKGKIGRSYEFDGADTKIDTGSDWIDTQAISVSAWIYARSLGENNDGRIVDNGGKFILGMNVNNKIYFTSNGLNVITNANNSVYLNQWYHVIITRTANGTANFYINGVLSGTANQNSGTPVAGTSNVIIGNNNSPIRTFDGRIDDLKVWNYVLTPWQIAQEYNGGGPIGHWKLDEGQGGTIYDWSGNGYNGTLVLNGSPATSTAWQTSSNCKINGCLDFDGTDDKVSVPYNAAFNMTNNLTLSAWINLDTAPVASDRILSHYYQYSLYINSDKSFRIQLRNSSATYEYLSSGKKVPLNQWTHLAATFQDGQVYFYADGQLISTKSLTTTTLYNQSSGTVTIGVYHNETEYFFDGTIDDARIYNYALSPQQIRKVYNMGYGTYFK